MTVPLPTSIRTWAVVAPRVTSTTRPLIMLRALSFIVPSSLRIIPSGSRRPALLDDRESPVDEEDEHQQQHCQRDGVVEVAFARLEHHGRRERSRLALDVAADHQP